MRREAVSDSCAGVGEKDHIVGIAGILIVVHPVTGVFKVPGIQVVRIERETRSPVKVGCEARSPDGKTKDEVQSAGAGNISLGIKEAPLGTDAKVARDEIVDAQSAAE